MRITLSILITFLLLTSCNLPQENIKNNLDENTWSEQKINKKDQLSKKEKELLAIEEKKQKIETIKKKLSLKWLIIKWNIYFKNEDYTSALIKYLQIYKEIPNDKSAIKDLWDVYFQLNKYKQSYAYYSKIKDYDKLNIDQVSRALINSVELKDENIDYIIEELKTLPLNEDQLFYYKNSVRCKQDFSFCKQKFQDYFNEEIETWSWKEIREIKFNELQNIKTALEDYDHSQMDDLSYKWALVSWAFFINKLYPIAIETSKKILQEKNDYRPLLKIVAKSYYELGNYIDAKIYLIKYNKLVENDYEASYFLWRIYEKLHEYVLSNIHLQKALKLWYPDTLDIRKRLLINYYEVWEIDKMLSIFEEIINENSEEVDETDYELAIYYHILNNKLKTAEDITAKALIKYPNNEVFYWYMWWILMEEINKKIISNALIWENNEINKETTYKESEIFIDKWLLQNPKNPMLNFVKWKLEVKLNHPDKAFIYFKKTISLDKDWEFENLAKEELKNIKINK